jgi:transposase InsO family protein
MGILHTMTTAYHPQANGLVERLHRRLKEALKARLAAATWPEHLPWVLLGIRSAPRDDSGISAAELVYGAPLCLPGVIIAAPEQPAEYFKQQLQGAISAFSPSRAPPQPPRLPPQQLQAAQFV